MNTITTKHPGCYGRDLLDTSKTYTVQDGYHTFVEQGRVVRGAPRWVEVPAFTAHPECMYDKRMTDPTCAGCPRVMDGVVDAELDPDFAEVATGHQSATDYTIIPLKHE